MNNNDLTWAKTLLSTYRYLGRITNALDRIFESRAINGNIMSSKYFSRNNVYSLTNHLIDLIDRKATLINLKLLVEDVLLSIDRDSARLLIKKYCDGRTSDEIAKILNVSRRTYFRKHNSSLNSFTKNLIFKGYDSESLFKKLSKEKWIIDAFNEIGTKKEDVEVISESFIGSVCKKLEKASVNY